MVSYEELTLNKVMEYNNCEIIVEMNGIEYHLKLALNEKFDSAVIFSNGAINRAKKTPPVFMRSTWSNEIEASCIFIDDPTIHDSDLSIGWGIGKPNHYFLGDIGLIIRKILNVYGIVAEKTLYYGSSAGGTMSLLLGSQHINSKVIVNNPQMRTDKFLSGRTIKEIRETLFTDYSEDEFLDKYKSRISVPYAFKMSQYVPQIVYMFNRKAYGDYGIQFKLFIEDMKAYKLELDNIKIIMYSDEKLGHNPISKESSIAYINAYLNNEKLWI